MLFFLWKIAFYKCLSLGVMVKYTGAIFVCEWIESIGWTPEKIVIFIQIGRGFSIGMLWFSFIHSLIQSSTLKDSMNPG